MKLLTVLPATLLLIQIFISNPVQAQQSSLPSFSFSPDTVTMGKNQEAITAIMVNTGNYSAGGAGVIIQFDPKIATVSRLERGSAFVDYPLVFFDNTAGEIRISGVVSSKDELFQGQGILGKIIWKGQSPGRTFATIDFTEDSTQDSNIAVLSGNGDVLEEAGYLSIIVQTEPVANDDATITIEEDIPVPKPETIQDVPWVGRILQILGITKSVNEEEGPIQRQLPNYLPSVEQPEITGDNKTKNIISIAALIGFGLIILIICLRIIKRIKQRSTTPIPIDKEEIVTTVNDKI